MSADFHFPALDSSGGDWQRDRVIESKQTLPATRWVYPVLLAAMVVVASGRGEVAAPSIVNIDKLAHFSIFGLLATLVTRMLPRKRWWVAIAAVSVFGVVDEFRQSLTPGRFVEVADWVADTSGAVVASVAYRFWALYRRVLETPLGKRARGVEKPPASPTPVTSAKS